MPTDRAKSESVGFGFILAPRAAYHFVVSIPTNDTEMVQVAENFVYNEDLEAAREKAQFAEEPLPYPIRPPQVKVEISRHKWGLVAEEVRAEFNKRLRTVGLKASTWKAGENRVAPHLGKELILLLWAIEHADPSQIPTAIANWQGLVPEERWWLYTTINAASGHASDRHGWRKAIQIAFTENPVSDTPSSLRSAPKLRSDPNEPNNGDSARRNGKRRKKDPDDDSQLNLL